VFTASCTFDAACRCVAAYPEETWEVLDTLHALWLTGKHDTLCSPQPARLLTVYLLMLPCRCVAAYPEETREVLDALYALWFDHLWDNIPTVREDSAAALANAVRAYGREALDKIAAVLR
jgi:hypothetical protein